MPQVYNGIGTWYYGKRNIHRIGGNCPHCNASSGLESYDTTLYFVVLFVPLIPLSKKRIIEKCQSCSMHSAMALKEWHRLKTEAVTDILDRLRADPDDRGTILEAIGVATTFQDEELFEKMTDSLAGDRTDDAAIQATLGQGYAYFARHDEAARAFVHSLKAEDNPEVRDQLGLTFLRLGDPERAAGCFTHIIDNAEEDDAWMLYQLVVAYQAEGMHAEALDVLDQIDETFPQFKGDKSLQKLRKVSVKDRGRNKPVGKSILMESTSSGTHEGSRLGSLIPLLILPLILLAFGTWHTWKSLTLAEAHPVVVVNGSPVEYSVRLNDVEYTLLPGTTQIIDLPEGTVSITPGKSGNGIEPVDVLFGSSFWGRPYDSTNYVINPDRLAVLIEEKTEYSANPPPDPPPTFHVGKPFYEFDDIDHFFEPLPASISVKEGSRETRKGLSLFVPVDVAQRMKAIVNIGISDAEITAYIERWLKIAPNEAMALKQVFGDATK